jgi:hypothetical protein
MDGRMRLDRDFSEFVGFLSAHKVRFLVVGGYAIAVRGHLRSAPTNLSPRQLADVGQLD